MARRLYVCVLCASLLALWQIWTDSVQYVVNQLKFTHQIHNGSSTTTSMTSISQPLLINANTSADRVATTVPPLLKRVAILQAGTVARFHLNTSAEHLVAPLVQSGWEVDYFLSLFFGPTKGWHELVEAFEPDFEFQHVNDTTIFTRIIYQKLNHFGANVVFNRVFTQQPLEFAEKKFIDTDKKFWNVVRGNVARNNFILLWKNLDLLWKKVVENEQTRGKYSYLIILRDDTFWFADFNLTKMLEIGGKPRMGGDGGMMYSILCDEKHVIVPNLFGGLFDYFFVVDRKAADVLCTTYERILQPALFGDAWQRFVTNRTIFGNSENFYAKTMAFMGVSVEEVPPGLMPFQRVGRQKGGLCLHKYCDSSYKGIDFLHPNLKFCER